MKIVIIGNGVAGATCALTARQRDRDAEITMISGETDFYFSRTALMYVFMDQMTRRELEPYERKAWDKQRIRRIRGWVVEHSAEKKQIQLEGGEWIDYDKLVLAVGAAPNVFPWEGVDQIETGLVNFVSMQDLAECERLTPSTDRAVVIGGGLIGIELVECLRYHGKEVVFLVREPWYWPMALCEEEARFVGEHMREHGVDLRLEEEMTRAEVGPSGRIQTVHTSKDNAIDCQLLGICAGVHPNIDAVKEFTDAPDTGKGIIVDQTFATSIPDVFACGDCAEIHPDDGKPYGEAIWYSAKRHGEIVGHNLFGGGHRYDPPLFFNSSKFFEIEYTTVGEVTGAPEGSPTIYLKHPGKPISARIVHDGERVIGFNMLGSRWNHEVLERWVHERRRPEWVLDNLRSAQYDVEFGRAKLSKLDRADIPLETFSP